MIYKTTGFITTNDITSVFDLMMKELNCEPIKIESVRITRQTVTFGKDEFKYEVWWT